MLFKYFTSFGACFISPSMLMLELKHSQALLRLAKENSCYCREKAGPLLACSILCIVAIWVSSKLCLFMEFTSMMLR